MGWTGGQLEGPFSARAAIAFECGDEFAERVIDAALKGNVVYAAVREHNGDQVFGLVLYTERHAGVLYTKAVTEEMGPGDFDCPARILALLSPTDSDYAQEWRARCRARLARPRPRVGDTVVFATPIAFTDGARHTRLTYCGGSRFSSDGQPYRVVKWSQLDYDVERSAA